jgi:hypothetical protein
MDEANSWTGATPRITTRSHPGTFENLSLSLAAGVQGQNENHRELVLPVPSSKHGRSRYVVARCRANGLFDGHPARNSHPWLQLRFATAPFKYIQQKNFVFDLTIATKKSARDELAFC